MQLAILFEDEDLLVLNKPSGILVHPVEDRLAHDLAREETCLSLARRHCGERVFPVHRLDRATSGPLLFAKSSPIAAQLCKQIENHAMAKEYVALVRGWFLAPQNLSHPVWNEIRTQRLEAQTQFSPLETFEFPVPQARHPTSRYSLVLAMPHTGRYHQIRQHLKHLSHPIVGDTAHGDGRHNTLFRERFALGRLFLHATSLSFLHPRSQALQTVKAPLPIELESVLQQLRRACEASS